LNVEILESMDFGTYTREKIVFDTRHNLSALGYLLVPKNARSLPAVVCLSGHGRGLPDILGLNDDGSPRAERGVGYAKEYALQCVEHGYVTFAVEQLALGTRRDDAARKAGPTAYSCQPAATAALLLGQSMAAWRVWDAMRAIDYLSTRPEVDSRRIATLGASGGGTTSLLTGALDERVKVTVVSAYFNTFRDSIVSISHCPDNYVPGLLQDMEMYDLTGLVAPRRLFVESGRKDRIFPIEGSQTAAAKAQAIYRAFDVSDHFGYEIHEGAHEFHGVGAFDFMKRWL
jgi:dienelactone hydrolase